MSVPFFKQFSHPEGKAGKVAGFIMSKENRKLNRWASGCLDLHPGEHVLEIGFGSGACIEKLLKNGVTVDGLDASASMAESAEKRLAPMIESGRVRIMQGKAEHIHLPENYYDKILSVNNFPIWGEPNQALERLYSSLKSDGRIVITVQPREDNASPNLTRMVGNDLYHRLEKAGFAHITLTYRYFWPHMAVTAVGFKEKRGS